jgi:transposase
MAARSDCRSDAGNDVAGGRERLDGSKAEAVQLVISSGQPVAEVARNLGIVEGTLGNWVAKARENGEVTEPELSVSERAELARLRKENQTLKMERDFLKKATAFFASQNQ